MSKLDKTTLQNITSQVYVVRSDIKLKENGKQFSKYSVGFLFHDKDGLKGIHKYSIDHKGQGSKYFMDDVHVSTALWMTKEPNRQGQYAKGRIQGNLSPRGQWRYTHKQWPCTRRHKHL